MNEQRALLLKPRTGLLIGAVAACAMLVVLCALRPDIAARSLLKATVQTLLPVWMEPAEAALPWAGLTVFVGVGAVLGLLHAACQQVAKLKFLASVGVFYGIVIHVASRVFIGRFAEAALASSIRSFSWLLACVAFGVSLGLLAHLVSRRASLQARTVPRD